MTMSGLFSDIFGKKDKSVPVDDLITRIDLAIDSLNITKKDSGLSEDQLISRSISDVFQSSTENKMFSKDDQSNSMDMFFKDLTVPEERLNKYRVYDTMYNNVQIIKKVLSVYIDNIFQKDTISNSVLLIKEANSDKTSGDVDEYKNLADNFIKFFNIEERLKNVVFNALKYGDSYIEYINLDDLPDNFPKVKKPISKDQQDKNPFPDVYDYVQESVSVLENSLNSKKNFTDIEIGEFSDLIVEYSEYKQKKSDDIFIYEGKTPKQKNKSMKGISLRFHTPHRIVPIVSEYDSILGYVEIKTIEKKNSGDTYNPMLGFSDILKKISTSQRAGTSQSTDVDKYDNILKQFSLNITKNILTKYKIFDNEIPKPNMSLSSSQDTAKAKKRQDEIYNEKIKSTLDEDLFYSLKRLLVDTGVNNLFHKKLSVRFIPVDKMFRFSISSSSSYPFGESVIDPLIYPGKIYLLTQLSNIVTKLSRSSVIRKWTVEVGAREGESDIVNRLKKQLRNQKITADDLTSSKEIPRVLSDFRDLITFTKKGQRFVDVETLQHGDPNVGIRDLEDIRKEIVALSGIPAPYLGYSEQIEMRR